MDILQALLIVHLAGLVMGFVGGRSHAEIMKRLPDLGSEASQLLWDYEAKASWTAFIGTGLLVTSGAAMLWLKWGGPGNQPPMFWLKIALVALVTWAEVARHAAATRWRRGDNSMRRPAVLWGKVSGLAATAIIVVAVLVFN